MPAFQLPAIEFYDNPMSAEDSVIDSCIEADFQGLVIAAPSRVNLGTRESLPVAGCWADSLRDAKRFPFDDTVIATAVCLETGSIYAALAVPPMQVAEPYQPSDRDPGEGTTYRMFLCDLRSRLGLPWKPGTYLVTLLQRDRHSNRVLAELSQADTFDDPEVRRLFLERLRKMPPPRIRPESATFRPIFSSPPVPQSAGVALNVPRVVVTEPGAQAVLAGSFSVPILEHQILSFEHRLSLEDTPAQGATGVIPMMIIISGSQRPRPIVLQLGIPTFDALKSGQPSNATGHFALDLLAIDALRRMPSQTYFIHVLAGEILSDAALAAFVDPRLLPDV